VLETRSIGFDRPKVSVIIPCHNEAVSIAEVIRSIRNISENWEIVVCDNISTDRTAEAALSAGATVICERKKGKGNAIRKLFRDVDADIYVMIDGDNTYGVEAILSGVELVLKGSDMVVGERQWRGMKQRPGHSFGNKAFSAFFRIFFDVDTSDAFSGFRVMSRRLIKTFPCISSEFEIEAELEIFCSRMRLPTSKIPVSMARRLNSESKLNTLVDGLKIFTLASRMLHREYPLRLYASLAFILMTASIFMGYPVVSEYLSTGLVIRLPTLIVCGLGMAISIILISAGLILKEVTNSRYELRYLHYLNYKERGRS